MVVGVVIIMIMVIEVVVVVVRGGHFLLRVGDMKICHKITWG